MNDIFQVDRRVRRYISKNRPRASIVPRSPPSRNKQNQARPPQNPLNNFYSSIRRAWRKQIKGVFPLKMSVSQRITPPKSNYFPLLQLLTYESP
jgi:hypothetical protein